MPHERFAASPGRAVARDVDGVNALEPLVLPVAPALPAAAVDQLPRGELGVPELDEDPSWRLVAAFLVECRRVQTRRAYFTDLKAWYAWCTKRELHPLAARRHDVALWKRQLAEQPRASGKAAAPASIARRLSCLSSFYGYALLMETLPRASSGTDLAPAARWEATDAPRGRPLRRRRLQLAIHAVIAS